METTNPELELARRYIEETGCHVFLTGKAGTGKTTFLRRLKQESHKRMIVVAPTGVAAINAGGVTIHSFFQLPFAPFIPGSTLRNPQGGKIAYRFGKEKINIIRSLDLLVIDEISMVRADLLDHIDAVLRRYRNHSQPFGGVQLLMIGDMQQLAPVIKEEEKAMLAQYYETFFFFGSHTLLETSFVTVELKKVYRQSDPLFLELLNKIRESRLDEATFSALNQRYISGFSPKQEEGYITLTTHNHQALVLNQQKLSMLPEQLYEYRASISGDFPEQLYPSEEILRLKKGAQIMFIKNDTEIPRRFYNGKIGRVWALSRDRIQVICDDWESPVTLERTVWDNTQYKLNPDSKEIEEKVMGTFEHYPLRTAWAITIHKSQGLTFDRVIINAGASFAHGQVYVALSRCRSLEGLVLSTPIHHSALIDDATISSFSRQVESIQHDEQEIKSYAHHYYHQLLSELFDFRSLYNAFLHLERMLDEHLYGAYPKLLGGFKKGCALFAKEIQSVSERFRSQYTQLLQEDTLTDQAENSALQARIIAAAPYFSEKLATLRPLLLAAEGVESDNKVIAKRWDDAFTACKTAFHQKTLLMEYAKQGFSLQGYLRAKAESTLTDTQKPTARKQKSKEKKLEVSSDMLHPELFERLKQWRNAKAADIHLPVYTVIQQKAMLGISNLLPTGKDELIRIPYFGKKSADKYGAEILEIVMEYRRKKKMSLL